MVGPPAVTKNSFGIIDLTAKIKQRKHQALQDKKNRRNQTGEQPSKSNKSRPFPVSEVGLAQQYAKVPNIQKRIFKEKEYNDQLMRSQGGAQS